MRSVGLAYNSYKSIRMPFLKKPHKIFELGHSVYFALAGVGVSYLYVVKHPLFTDQLTAYDAAKAS